MIDGEGNVADCQLPAAESGGIEVSFGELSAESTPSSRVEFEIRRTGSAAGKTPDGISLTVSTGAETHYQGDFQYEWTLTDNRGETCQPCAEHTPELHQVQVPT